MVYKIQTCVFMCTIKHVSFCNNAYMYVYKTLAICKGGSRTGAPGARPPRFEKNYGFVFVNFNCITRIYFDFSQ